MWQKIGSLTKLWRCGVRKSAEFFETPYKLNGKIFSRKNFRANRTNCLSYLPYWSEIVIPFLFRVWRRIYEAMLYLYKLLNHNNFIPWVKYKIWRRLGQIGQTIYPICNEVFSWTCCLYSVSYNSAFSALRISAI